MFFSSILQAAFINIVKIPNAYLAIMCLKQLSSHFRISPYHSSLTLLETVCTLHVKYMLDTNTSTSSTADLR